MSLQSRYLGGMLSGAGSVMLRTALNIVVVPLLIAHLGMSIFGLYLLLIALLEIAQLMDLGATNALVTMLGGLDGTAQDEAQTHTRKKYLRVGQLFYCLLSGLILAGGFIIWPHFNNLFHIEGNLQHSASMGFLFIVLESTLLLASCYFHALLLSHCSHQWTNISDSIYNLIATAGAIVLLMLGYDFTAVMAVRLVGAVIRFGLMGLHAYRLEPLAFSLKLPFDFKALKDVITLSSHAMMLNFSVIISHKIDDIVIARFLPISAVGIYEIVFRFLGITVQVCMKLSEGTFPLFSRMAAQKQTAEAKELFLRMSSFLYIVAALIMMMIVCNYVELFQVFSAHQIPSEQTLPVIAIAVPCLLSGVLQMPANALLFASGHRKYLTITSVIAALSNVTLSVILVKFTPLGIVGVALGTLIPQVIQHQAGTVRKACSILSIPGLTYLREVHGSILLPVLVCYLWITLFRPLTALSEHPIWPIGLIAASGGVLGFALWFILTARPREKELLQRKVILPLQARFKSKPNVG